MDFTYKHLSTSDIQLLKQVLKMFGDAFNEPDIYGDAIPSDEYLQRLLSKTYFIVLAAMDGDEVVGGLAAYELQKFEQERKEIYIYDLAVAEDYRRKGIATKLIQELQKLGKERNAYVIFVQADYEDDAAIRLYESLGVREEVLHFDIPVK
jgi:aminoglycoside 3-N-acetyltransferase I